MRLAVGVSSRKASGLSAALSSTPCSLSIANPVSWTIRSRAKRFAVSTRMTRTVRGDPFHHGREARTRGDGIGAAHRLVAVSVEDREPGRAGKRLEGRALAL